MTSSSMSVESLALCLRDKASAPLILDVRRQAARAAQPTQISGAVWRDPALWLDWKDSIPADRPVLLYCAHGMEISQGLTHALQVMGRPAAFLVGGWAQWQASGASTEPAA